MQLGPRAKPPVGVIFDCDMGNSADDAVALAVLYGLDGLDECRVIAVSTSKPNLKSAAMCEVIERFYAGTGGRPLPAGMALKGAQPEDTPILNAVLEKRGGDGKPVYAHSIERTVDTADPEALIRNSFTSQFDQNCVAVLTGPATNFRKMLDLPGVKPLIEEKVRTLVVMGGRYPSGGPEFNVKADIAAARKLFAEWPGDLVASGEELGEQLPFPASAIETKFAWAAHHPVVDAYRADGKMPYDAKTWDVTAVLQAVRPKAEYFKLSEPGRIEVLEDGQTRFTPSAGGRHRYLILDPEKKTAVVEAMVALASAKPVVRQRRFRPPAEEKKDAAKKDEQKKS
ncbi:MAG: nucleoside hydrolase [Bryobacterales bacterium]|nr:nucleoside hydrolase [Bryobacterales bacterium]